MHRRLLLTALALVAGAASGCAPPVGLATGRPTWPVSSPSSSPPAPTCSAAGTQLSADEVDGASGLRAMGVHLLNCGAGTIVLDGYPAAHLFDKGHDPIVVTVNDGVGVVTPLPSWEQPPAKVTLRPGDSAISLLVWRNLTEGGPDGPVTAVFLDLAAASGRAFEPVANVQAIDLGTTALLGVSPWVAARPGAL